jgi:hypothetical protein
MAAWAAVVGQEKITARKVSEWASGEGLASASGQNLREALLAIAGVRDEIDTRRLGNWLRANKGARLEGYAFEDDGKANGQVLWRLRQYEGGTLFDKADGQKADGQIANFPVRSRPSSTEEEELFQVGNFPRSKYQLLRQNLLRRHTFHPKNDESSHPLDNRKRMEIRCPSSHG